MCCVVLGACSTLSPVPRSLTDRQVSRNLAQPGAPPSYSSIEGHLVLVSDDPPPPLSLHRSFLTAVPQATDAGTQ